LFIIFVFRKNGLRGRRTVLMEVDINPFAPVP